MRWFSVRSGRRAIEDEIREELRAHVELAADHLRERGLSPEDAQQAARGRFGDFEIASRMLLRSARQRDARIRFRYRLEEVGRDVSIAIRQAARSPVFVISLIMTLALGIGANAAVYTILRSALLQPLPYSEPDRLVMIWRSMGVIPPSESPRIQAALRRGGLTPTHLLEWRSATRGTFVDVAGIESQGSLAAQFDLALSDRAERLRGALVTPNFFELLGVRAALGRLFQPADDASGEALVVLGHALWNRGFGGDSSIIGRSISLVGGRPRQPRSYTVIGVLPPSFRFTYPREVEAWSMVPWAEVRAMEPRALAFNAIGRIRDDVTFDQAVAAARLLDDPFDSPGTPLEHRKVAHLEPMREWIVGATRPSLILLSCVSALLLTMTCVTVANALLARVTERKREMAIRASLGAGGGRLVRQLATEGALLAVAGTAVGISLAALAQPLLRTSVPASIPRVGELALDPTILLFAAVVVGVTTVLAAVAPALTGARTDWGTLLRHWPGASASGPAVRWRQVLVSIQAAISTCLLIGAGLLLVSLWRLGRVPLGFDGEKVLTVELRLLGNRYWPVEARATFQQQLMERIRAIPGVREAGLTSAVPFRGVDFYLVPDGPDSARSYSGNGRYVDPAFFSVLRIPLRRGRLLTGADRMGAPRVVVVSETWARRAFGDEDPVGRFIDLDGPVEIIGVVGDVRYTRFEEGAAPAIYLPRAQAPSELMCIVARTDVPAAKIAPLIHRAVRELDPTLPAMHLTTLDRIIEESVSDRRFYTIATASFASLALLLTVAGLGIVVARVVVERRREFAVRSALGARAGSLVAEATRSGLRAAAVGIVAGMGVAYAAAGAISRFLFDVPARSPAGFLVASAAMLLVASLAAAIPARRVMAIPLASTLRSE